MRKLVTSFIKAVNSFDIDGALALFAPGAVIEDASVGNAFVGTAGVRVYLERYFVGYHTRSKLLSIQQASELSVTVRLDFRGDFGHETGILKFEVHPGGLIARIDAELE
ncbi:nuclear transport factor 2 family protein [Rhizobium leguminosarum]|uniref:nuclear transport factor 2 family protein n=1 Tax=Rhizobium TaxID=379 RepID=UPI00103062C0|nr:nuclear transport factor 2 family protein [Rhizobium leguminosarum]TBF87499.1 nuclear transport factor 2 family protein [Rhizobium leguminosarum]TBG06975.1 nuclear transport factor 2 family protein [Rhizobium leguminosarum]TBG07846.1 nuclear transport factor 2 family protein [Rhizobium leguminosarum]TBG30012.1 nuclear transport factor 2 family protein [Rhizobium leguminosarum]TBG50145.1 nuclear transport factor 2 family protein [Rhizobium leguminosarum]